MIRRRSLLAAVAAALPSCGSSPEPDLYTLLPIDGTPLAANPGVVEVRKAILPGHLDRDELVRAVEPGRLQVLPGARWGGSLRDLIAIVVAENLVQRLPRGRVYPALGGLALPHDAALEIALSAFEADPAGVVRLAGYLTVRPEGGRRRAPAIRPLRITAPARHPGIPGITASMNTALAELSDVAAAMLVA
jgi:uncharacterized lipoprotein YmbA